MSVKKVLADGFYIAKSNAGFERFIGIKNGRSVLSWRSETGTMGDLYASIVTEFEFESYQSISAEEFWSEIDKVNLVFKNLLS